MSNLCNLQFIDNYLEYTDKVKEYQQTGILPPDNKNRVNIIKLHNEINN